MSGKRVTLMLDVEVVDQAAVLGAAFANRYPPADDREAVVGAVVGKDLEAFEKKYGLKVWSALARWTEGETR